MRRSDEGTAVSRRILIVDDNADFADSLSMLLMLDGHRTLCVYDGRAAVDAANDAFAPEIVLLDLSLPELDGYEVARILHSGREAPPALVALSGWDRHSARSESGFDAHLVKPVDYEVLRHLLERLSGDAG